MKKTILIIFLLSAYLHASSQEKLYKELGKTQILTYSEYEMLKQVKIKKFENSSVQLSLEETILDSIRIGETTIYTYKLARILNGIKFSPKASVEKIYSLLGKRFPDFSLKSLDGEEVNLSDLKGKAVLMNFWFTGCGPCIKEMPALSSIQEKYGDQLICLSISFHDKKELDHFFKNHRFTFKHLTNARSLIDKIGITAYPKNIILTKEGKIHQILDGIHQQLDENGNVVNGDGREIIREIERVL